MASFQHPSLLHIAATTWDSKSGHSTVAATSFPSSKPLGLLKDKWSLHCISSIYSNDFSKWKLFWLGEKCIFHNEPSDSNAHPRTLFLSPTHWSVGARYLSINNDVLNTRYIVFLERPPKGNIQVSTLFWKNWSEINKKISQIIKINWGKIFKKSSKIKQHFNAQASWVLLSSARCRTWKKRPQV